MEDVGFWCLIIAVGVGWRWNRVARTSHPPGVREGISKETHVKYLQQFSLALVEQKDAGAGHLVSFRRLGGGLLTPNLDITV